ncbi:MAG: T9SS type A sorting domain-containing protein [Bacteroidales bacterium]|nr:T9SS type A sorting domain-containing protein [Bacteroidales bacterium]MBN2761905.1 T9SS type A sorting domain-containing protein [Bacteroidales bacterium]
MKKQIILFLSVYVMLNIGNITFPQCTPDTINCIDTDNPGQICPEGLPDGYVGLPYSQTVTILPPSTATISDVIFTLVKIRIDSVSNLPPGISYEANATEMYPDTAYCVLISGIPTEPGEFKINIQVVPYISIMDSIVESPVVANDTSVKIIIHESSGIQNMHHDGFQLTGNTPNPFTASTTIGFFANESSPVRLNIYNYAGMLVYSEILESKSGKNYFRFTGETLPPGYYIYSVTHRQNVYTGKLVKPG